MLLFFSYKIKLVILIVLSKSMPQNAHIGYVIRMK